MLRILMLTCVLCTCTHAQTSDSRTIFQYLNDEGFKQVVDLMLASGLDGEFSDATSTPKTIFAPTDQAFALIPQDIQVKLLTNMSFVREVLNGHVTDEQILTLLIRDGVQKMDQNGNPLTFNVYPNGVKTVNGARIGAGDVILANGLVHSIDKVLLPITESISGYVAEHDTDFRDLFGFLVLAKLFGTLGGRF
ncbi:hypothetical protein BaRGS_00005019 [Batillaria attramentaria]|uniref:FAS1 domain-containing protein n=1 Tax=Batillaria attramentaria TaxID=370345 RepID=A0ABD0LXQ1_9CAEN